MRVCGVKGMGLAMGGAVMFGGPIAAAGLIVGGAAYSAATGGWSGLGDFASGLGGGILGGTAGLATGVGIGKAIKSGNAPNLSSERGSIQITRAKDSLKTDQKTNVKARLRTNYDVEGKAKSFDLVYDDEATGCRYVGSEEAAKIAETGYVPNVNKSGMPKSVFYTPDEGLNSATQAQRVYKLPATPTYRIDLDTRETTNIYGGNGQGIDGIEMITNDKIRAVNNRKLNK